MLDTGVHLSALAADSEALADLAAEHLDIPVPACPEWSVADLLRHQGGVYSWATLVVEAGGARPTAGRDGGPPGTSGLADWFLERRAAVLDALTSREPDGPAWSFLGDADVRWWRRRMACETAIHLHDVEAAAGVDRPVAPELAADGVDELLTGFLPRHLRRQPVAGLSGTVHLHATDTPGEWVVDFSGPEVAVRRDHAKCDTAVRGTASELFLWAWNRGSGESLEVFGERSVLAAWRAICL